MSTPKKSGDVRNYRPLTDAEVSILESRGNTAESWATVLVEDEFKPERIHNCRFHGRVRIGSSSIDDVEFGGVRRPAGLFDSYIHDSDVGRNVLVDGVRHLSHVVVHDGAVLINVGEISCTEAPQPFSIDVWNENGGRSIHAFEGMLSADAYLWAKRRDDAELMQRFAAMSAFDLPLHTSIGGGSVVQNTHCIRNTRVGQGTVISGAARLQNVLVRSRRKTPVEIGEGVELVNTVVGEGCRVLSGVKAHNVLLCPFSLLQLGARVIHSVIGENSQVYCGEVVSTMIFPFHVQHHNNSFLISSYIEGQCNIAAGATIGSNNNSRAFDGELHARRGFWPGLCVSLKHNSSFASFTLLAKGAYPAELNIPLPYSLVANDEKLGQLTIMPAYWAMYNFYALARTSYKFQRRDQRVEKPLDLEFDFIAPDTIQEMFAAMALLEFWTGKAAWRDEAAPIEGISKTELRKRGQTLLLEQPDKAHKLSVLGEGIEKSRRPVVILKADQGYVVYRQMIQTWCVRKLFEFQKNTNLSLEQMQQDFQEAKRFDWINLGGQLAPADAVDALCRGIKEGQIAKWEDVHAEYQKLAERSQVDKAKYAWAALHELLMLESGQLDESRWRELLTEAVNVLALWAVMVRQTRAKDFDDPFRQLSYDSAEEMKAVLGCVDDDEFIRETADQAEAFAESVNDYLNASR